MDSTTGLLITITLVLVLAFIIYKIIKPYIIKYDTTLLFTGGLGSGKTLNSVKMAIKLYRKQYFFAYKWANFKIRFKNLFRKKDNKLKLKKPPMLYSNIPICYKKHFWSLKRTWASKLKVEHLLLVEGHREYSVILIDELPQFINQFNWNDPFVQKNVNEYISLFRHYVGGYLICNAQSQDDVVVQIRRKLNSCIWCRNFAAHLFKTFYSVEMCTLAMSDNVANINQTQLEENTQRNFGILLGMNKTYDTRCYRPRYENILKKDEELTPSERLMNKHNELATTDIMRLQEYISPLDDKTTKGEKQKVLDHCKELKTRKESK